jgi:uncharacterized protein YecT (DUF1311 family)
MRVAGGVIGLIAGIFGFIAAIFTLFVGGLGAAFEADGGEVVVALGWGGVFFSFLVIIFSGISLGVRRRWPGFMLILSSIGGAILGGTFVAVLMVLSLVGGLLAIVGGGTKTSHAEGSAERAPEENSQPRSGNGAVWLYVMGGVVGMTAIVLVALNLPLADEAALGISSNQTGRASETGPDLLNPSRDAILIREFHVEVTEIRTATVVGSSVFRREAAAGELFVLVSLMYRNESDAPVPASRQPQIRLLDPAGNRYSADLGASSAYATEAEWDANLFSDLNPGLSRSTGDAFVVAASRFDPSAWRLEVSVGRQTALFALDDDQERSDEEALHQSSAPTASAPSHQDELSNGAEETGSAQASFDCAAATTPAEILICSTNELRLADYEMGRAYSTARAAASSDERNDLLQQQRAWIRSRNSICGADSNPFRSGPALNATQECFMAQTRARTAELGGQDLSLPAQSGSGAGQMSNPNPVRYLHCYSAVQDATNAFNWYRFNDYLRVQGQRITVASDGNLMNSPHYSHYCPSGSRGCDVHGLLEAFDWDRSCDQCSVSEDYYVVRFVRNYELGPEEQTLQIDRRTGDLSLSSRGRGGNGRCEVVEPRGRM